MSNTPRKIRTVSANSNGYDRVLLNGTLVGHIVRTVAGDVRAVNLDGEVRHFPARPSAIAWLTAA